MDIRNLLSVAVVASLLVWGQAFAQTPPTPEGTAVSSYDSNATSEPVSITIGANCDAVLVVTGGFNNTTVTSVTLNGNAMETIVSGQNGTNQFGGLYYMDTADPNWPGTGTFTVNSTIGAGEQLHVLASCFQDIDTTTAGYRTAVENNGNNDDPSVSLTGMTASTDTMFLGAIFYENQGATPTTGTQVITVNNGSGGSSSIMTYDNAVGGASDSIGITTTAAVDHWMAAVALIGTGGGGGGGAADVHTMQDPSKSVGPHKSQTLGGHLEVSNL